MGGDKSETEYLPVHLDRMVQLDKLLQPAST